MEFRERHTYLFTYGKAVTGPDRRVLTVREVGPAYAKGYDHSVEEHRTFSLSQVSDAEEVATAAEEIVRPDEVLVEPEGVPPALLVEVYEAKHPDALSVRYHEGAGVLVVRRPQDPRAEVTVRGTKVAFHLVAPNGERIGIAFQREDGSPLGTSADIGCPLTPEAVRAFRSGLADLFPEKPAGDPVRELLKQRLYQ